MADDTAPKGTLTIGPASEYISASTFSLRRLAHDGVIPCSYYLNRLHFRVEDLDKYIADNMLEVA